MGVETDEAVIKALVDQLSEKAEDLHGTYLKTREADDWAGALVSILGTVKYRALGLAVASKVILPDQRWTDPEHANRIFSDAIDDVLEGSSGDDLSPTSPYFIAAHLDQALEAVFGIEQEFESAQRGQPLHPLRLAIHAAQLGEVALIIELLHAGHYEEVKRLQERRIGREPGWTKRWPIFFAPHLQEWWNKNATVKTSGLVAEALRYRDDDENGYPTLSGRPKDEQVPNTEGGMRAAISGMLMREQLRRPSAISK